MNHGDDTKHTMASLTHWSLQKAIYRLLGVSQELKEDIGRDNEDYLDLRKKVEADIQTMATPEDFINKLLPFYRIGERLTQEKKLYAPKDKKISSDAADHIYWVTKHQALESYEASLTLRLAADGVYQNVLTGFLRKKSKPLKEINAADLDKIFRQVCEALFTKIKDGTLRKPQLYAYFEKIERLAQEDMRNDQLIFQAVGDVQYVKPWDFASWVNEIAVDGQLPFKIEKCPDDICKLTLRKPPEYSLWAQRQIWTIEQAASLINDREPVDIPLFRELEKPLLDFLESSDPTELCPVRNSHAYENEGKYVVYPRAVISWCKEKDVLVSPQLEKMFLPTLQEESVDTSEEKRPYCFLWEGKDCWTFAFDGESKTVIHGYKGFGAIHHLLKNPQKPVGCVELQLIMGSALPVIQESDNASGKEVKIERNEGFRVESDVQYKKTLKRTPSQKEIEKLVPLLREQMAEAEALASLAQPGETNKELENTLNGLKAKLKELDNIAERDPAEVKKKENARVNVQRAIKKAIEEIGYVIPEMGTFLKASIKFGYDCTYLPEKPIDWSL